MTALTLGERIREARLRKRWTLRQLATAANLSVSVVHSVENGRVASLSSYVRLARVLGLELGLSEAVRTPTRPNRLRELDPVHATMGELEAQRLSSFSFPVGIDEPYQHFQFAGRGDALAWDLSTRSLIHFENRTRFPNTQETAGSWNSKRAYLPAALAERLEVRGGWASVTHVMAALWTGEVVYVVRRRAATFRALCPDDTRAFEAWWRGKPPVTGVTSTFVLFDPCAGGRQAPFASLGSLARAGFDARHAGYAEVATRLRSRSPNKLR